MSNESQRIETLHAEREQLRQRLHDIEHNIARLEHSPSVADATEPVQRNVVVNNTPNDHTVSQKIDVDIHDLRQSELRLRTIIQHSADAIVVNGQGVVRFANPAAEMLFQQPASELIGKELGIPVVTGDKAEIDIYDHHGKRLVAEMRTTDIEWEGEPAYLATFREITNRKLLEEELERRVQERTLLLQHTMQQLEKELSEREKAERAILRRDAILEAIEFASHRFLRATNITHELPFILEYFGKATTASRVVLFTVTTNTNTLLWKQRLGVEDVVQQLVWLSPSYNSELEEPRFNATAPHKFNPSHVNAHTRKLTRWIERLSRGFPIHGDVRTFPPEERLILEAEYIQSLVVVPVFMQHSWWGFIEFDVYRSRRVWTLSEVEALRAAASMISSAYQHEHVLETLHKSKEDLKKSEAYYRAIVEDQTDPICRFLPDGTLTFVNCSYCRYVQQTQQEVTGQLFYLFTNDIQAETKITLDNMLAHFRANSAVFIIEHSQRTDTGDVRWLQWNNRAIMDENGTIIEIQSVGRDITEHIRAEEGLRHRSQQLEETLQARLDELHQTRNIS